MRPMWFPDFGEPKKLHIDHQMPQPGTGGENVLAEGGLRQMEAPGRPREAALVDDGTYERRNDEQFNKFRA
jgi:hypothetical protein